MANGDVWNYNEAGTVLCYMQTPMDCHTELVYWLSLPRAASASRHAQSATVHGRICACRRRGVMQPSTAHCSFVTDLDGPACTVTARAMTKARTVFTDSSLNSWPSNSSKLAKPGQTCCTDAVKMFVQPEVGREVHAEQANMHDLTPKQCPTDLKRSAVQRRRAILNPTKVVLSYWDSAQGGFQTTVAKLCKTSFKLHDSGCHFIADTVPVKLRIVGERVNVHTGPSIFLDDFGWVCLIQDEETRAKTRSLWQRADSVNHGRRGTTVNDAERAVMHIYER